MNAVSKLLTASALGLLLTACGGSSGGESFTIGNGKPPAPDPGVVSIGFSDAPVDDVKEVTIEVDKITFRKSGDDVVVDTFTIPELNLVDAETFQINLLDYQGSNQLLVIDSIELEDGEYSDIILDILDEDLGNSYVVELDDDDQKIIKVPSDTLKLGSFTVTGEETQKFTVEFNLRESLVYKPGDDEYNLKPRGVRIQNNSDDSSLSGNVASELFDTETDCAAKTEPLEGNVIYLYEGHGLDIDDLVDTYDPSEDQDEDIPSGAERPFTSVAVDGSENYKIAFLPAGDYTLAFSCNAADDDPEQYDGLKIPYPDDQIMEVTLTAGSSGTNCDLPIENESCADN